MCDGFGFDYCLCWVQGCLWLCCGAIDGDMHANAGWAVGSSGSGRTDRQWACRQKRIQNTCRATAALPPYRTWKFRAPAGKPQQAWSTGQVPHSVSPCPLLAGTSLLECLPACRGGSRLPHVVRIGGALTARLRETETWKRAYSLSVLCLCPSVQSTPSMHTPLLPPSLLPSPLPNHQSTITQQVWPAWSFLVLSFVPLSINPSSCHHITSPRIAHRIASQLPAVDISASRPVRPPIDFYFFHPRLNI